MTTTVSAVILGIFLVMTIKPGSTGKPLHDSRAPTTRVVLTTDTLMDLIRLVRNDNVYLYFNI